MVLSRFFAFLCLSDFLLSCLAINKAPRAQRGLRVRGRQHNCRVCYIPYDIWHMAYGTQERLANLAVISALGMSENGTAITAVCTHSVDANRCRCFFSQLHFRNCSASFSILIDLHHILSGVSYIRPAEQLPWPFPYHKQITNVISI